MFNITKRPEIHQSALASFALLLIGGILLTTPIAGLAALPANQSDVTCTTPDLVEFPSAPLDVATPIGTPGAIPLASPVASPSGFPVQTSPNLRLQTQIETLVRIIAECQSRKSVKTLVNLVTERFLGDMYAGGGRITKDQFVALGPELPRLPVEILSVQNVLSGENGSVTAEIESIVSHQLFNARWSFSFSLSSEGDDTGDEPRLGSWLATGVAALPVEIPDDANVTRVNVDEYRYDPKSLRVNGPNIVISVTNEGDLDHEVLVLQLDDGVTTDKLLSEPGSALPLGFRVIGQLTIPAGERGQLVLINMKRGEYTLVDLLPDSNGTPHLARGMKATLTIVR